MLPFFQKSKVQSWSLSEPGHKFWKKKRNFDLYVSTYRQWMSNKSGKKFSSFQHAWCTPWKLFGHAFFIFYFFMILTRGMNVCVPAKISINLKFSTDIFAFCLSIFNSCFFFQLKQALYSISGLLAVICN